MTSPTASDIMPAMTFFREWLATSEHRHNITDLAGQLGVSRSTIYDLCEGKRVPRLATMLKIKALTDGKVTPQDFVLEVEAHTQQGRAA